MTVKMSHKRSRSTSPPHDSDTAGKIYRSAPIEDRASTFTAFYSPSLPLSVLQEHPFFKTASHRIAAWRKPSRQRTVLPGAPPLYESGFDDDGESYAGRKVAKVMEVENVQGSLVVGRWYGGILLGPVRFKHIEDVAHEAIRKYKDDINDTQTSKKPRVIGSSGEHQKLIGELQQRDQSILVLRALLEEKKTQSPGSSAPASFPSASGSSPSKVTDYSEMPLARLKQLDKARDATVSWLLKQIDQAEKAQKSPR